MGDIEDTREPEEYIEKPDPYIALDLAYERYENEVLDDYYSAD
jgi:hypothetical protein